MNRFRRDNRFAIGHRRTAVGLLAGVLLSVLFHSSAIAQGKLDIKRHDISISLYPETHMLEALDRLTIEAVSPGQYMLQLGLGLEVEKLLIDGQRILYEEVTEEELLAVLGEDKTDDEFYKNTKSFSVTVQEEGQHILEIRYNGFVYDTLKVPEYSRGTLAEETTGIIGDEGVFLGPETHWYPDQADDYTLFSVKVQTPAGFESLTEGKLVERHEAGEFIETMWDADYPTKGLYLVAGKYLVEAMEAEGVKIMGYFFPSEKDLIDRYLKASSRYIEMYNKLIGPYPFSKFAVVENFFPTGYGMPSFTLLGRRVVRLPFIVHTSLGHEVAHNWWGNSVYVDYDNGNWCEGLTVYFADYRYKEAMSDSAAMEYRRTINIDYTSYVDADNDFPLNVFHERTTPASRTIGYGKCAMVFHMLKRKIGEEMFYRALRRFYRDYQFREASWDDIKNTFEKVTSRNLASYFGQWVHRKGAPTITLGDVALNPMPGGYHVEINITQEPVYDLLVPIVIIGEDTTYRTDVNFMTEEGAFTFDVGFEPRAIAVDPNHDVFRRLSTLEIPPTISGVLGDEKAVIALPTRAGAAKRTAFDALANQLGRTGEGRVMEDTMVTDLDLLKGSVIILGCPLENNVYSLIEAPAGVTLDSDHFSVGGIGYPEQGHSAFITFRNPLNSSASVCLIIGNSAESIEKSGYKIIHYGKYSYVTFLDGKRMYAGIFPVEHNPLFCRFESP